MKKEGILQRLGELKQEKKQLKKQLKELPSLEVGKWYKSIGGGFKYLLYLVSIDNGLDSCTAYGFVDDEFYIETDINFDMKQVPATDKEVETALIKEAKKRGFKEGVRFNNACKTGEIAHGKNTGVVNKIRSNDCGLFTSNQYIIFNGKWAEIIEEPKTVTLNGEFTEVNLKDIIENRF